MLTPLCMKKAMKRAPTIAWTILGTAKLTPNGVKMNVT